MSQLQFVFGNPRKKRRASVKRKVKRRKNPQTIVARKGRSTKKIGPIITTSEAAQIAKGSQILKNEIKNAKTAIAAAPYTGASAKPYKAKLKKLQSAADAINKKLKSEINKAKKARKTASALRAKGYKTSIKKLTKEEAELLKEVNRLKKKVKSTKKKAKRRVSVAKKKARKKVTRKKAARKKAVRKKATKKKATRKKATRKKAVRKKATRKKATRKKATRKKATRKKATRKKAARKKATRRRKAKKKVGKKQYTLSVRRRKNKSKKAMSKTKAFRKARKASKRLGKGRKRKFTFKTNPLFGGNMKIKKFLRHDLAEASGLALGGLSHGAVNDIVSRYLPGLASNIQRVLGNFSGSFFPLVAGVGLGMLADRSKGKFKEYGAQVAKGLIGSSVVGLGATGYEVVRPALGMSGLVQQNSALSGEYNQLGEESDYMIGARRGYLDGEYEQLGGVASHDYDWTSSHSEEPYDFGVEYEPFEGEYDQLG